MRLIAPYTGHTVEANGEQAEFLLSKGFAKEPTRRTSKAGEKKAPAKTRRKRAE